MRSFSLSRAPLAVRKGMLRSRGQFLLMADADGASAFGDVDKLLAQAKRVESEQKKTKSGTASSQWKDGDGLVVAVGSRAHLSSESSADGDDAHADASTGTVGGGGRVKRSPIRRFLMWGFRTLLSFAVGSAGIKDTQCGFKLFSRSAARLLFPVQVRTVIALDSMYYHSHFFHELTHRSTTPCSTSNAGPLMSNLFT